MELTKLEQEVYKIMIDRSFDECGEFSEDQNMSHTSCAVIENLTGYSSQKIGGILSSLMAKTKIYDLEDGDFLAIPPQ